MRNHAFIPKKSLGQHFLIDSNIKQKIISACHLKPTDIVVEIGPGQGILTQEIRQAVSHVTAIEKDHRLAAYLSEQFQGTNITIIEKDFLNFDLTTLPSGLKVIGNLPYNMATPIIEKVIQHRKCVDLFYMTVQLEYGQRMVAQPHTKAYGAFSCFVQYYTDVRRLFNIKDTAFYPRPKVQSCFIHMYLPRHPKFETHDEELLFQVIHHAFQQRRKRLPNALSPLFPKQDISQMMVSLDIDPQSRAENLTLEDFVRLTNLVYEVIKERKTALKPKISEGIQ